MTTRSAQTAPVDQLARLRREHAAEMSRLKQQHAHELAELERAMQVRLRSSRETIVELSRELARATSR